MKFTYEVVGSYFHGLCEKTYCSSPLCQEFNSQRVLGGGVITLT